MAEMTAGIKDIAGAGKRHYIWFAVLILLVLFLGVRFRKEIGNAIFAASPTVAGWFGVTAAAAAALLCFFGLSGVAEAATCCAEPLRHAVQSPGGFLELLATLGAGAAGSAMFGMVAFGAPDVVEAKLSDGNKVVNFTPSAAEPSYDFFVNGTNNVHPVSGRPLCATAQVIELQTTVSNLSTGTNPITDDDLGRLVKKVTMHGDPLGTILDDTVGTGPILKHLIEFVGLGFNRGADAPVATVTVPSPSGSNDATYTRYITIPHAQGYMVNPMASALWLGLIDQLRVTVTLAASTRLGGISGVDIVSANAVTKGASTLRVTTPVVPYNKWHWPVLAQWILEQPTGGSTSFTLRRFGEANASGSVPTDWVHTIAYLSNKVGLGGNQALDNIASVQSPKLGILDCQNVPALLKERLEAQRYGQSSPSYTDNMNYVQGTVPTGMNLASAKFLMLRQPGLDMIMDNMTPTMKGFLLPVDMTYVGAAPSTNHSVVIGALRFLSDSIAAAVTGAPNSKLTADRQKVIAA
jgi:hypothetical protein